MIPSIERSCNDHIEYYDLGTDAAAAPHSWFVTGDIIQTNYHDSNRVNGSGGQFKFIGTTTPANAGNWPYTDGYFYDADGKKFSLLSNPISPLQFGASSGGTTSANATAFRAMIAAGAYQTNVFIPAGSYAVEVDGGNNYCLLTDSIDNLTISGYGAKITSTASEKQIWRFADCDNLHVEGLWVVGANANGTDVAAGIIQVSGGAKISFLNTKTSDSDQDGLAIANATNVKVIGHISDNDAKSGVYVNGSSYVTVKACQVTNWGGATVSSSPVGAAIQVSSNTDCIVEGNICDTGTGYGIFCNALSGGARPLRNTIKGNQVYNATNPTNVNVSGGINCVNGNATKDTGTLITGNILRANGLFNIYIENHGGSYVQGNICLESVRSNIVVSTISNCIVRGNYIANTNTSNTATQSGVRLINAADGCVVIHNDFVDSAQYATSYGLHYPVDASTGTNLLQLQRIAEGVVTITSGNTYSVVTHGLAKTPSQADIVITPASGIGAAKHFWVDGIGATTFQLNLDVDPTTTVTLAWTVFGF